MQGEIVLYRDFNETNFQIEVRVEDETVWLTQAQMAELFQTTPQNITIHIKNIYNESELQTDGTCKDYLQVQKEGSRQVKRKTQMYNLDVIISVGYRVKSVRGTQFRIWANKILKEYLLKGYAINQRIETLETKVNTLENRTREFDLHIKTTLPPHEGVFFDGQIFEAYAFVSEIIKSAKKSIILIDNYIDETVLLILAKRKKKSTATIYTANLSDQNKLDIEKHNQQYTPIVVTLFRKSHDRFLIIDNKTVYHIGASLKDLGKKWFAFSKMNLKPTEILNKLEKK